MFRKFAAAAFIVTQLIFSLAFSADADSRDHPLFRSPAGYSVVKYSSGGGFMSFPSGAEQVSMPGQLTEIFYYARSRAPLSTAALGNRFVESLRSAGGEAVFMENPALGGMLAVGKLARPGRDVWVKQEIISRREYHLSILETANLRTAVPYALVSADFDANFEIEAQALDLLHTLDRTGRLELTARFAAGTSTLVNGYQEDFKKFIMMMEKDPSLTFRVAAYADSGMKPADQRVLVRNRAVVLIDVLQQMGADEKRLTSEAPVGETMDLDVPVGFARLTSVNYAEPASQ